MAKQQFTFTLDAGAVARACTAHVAGMVDAASYELETVVDWAHQRVSVKATKKRTRKPKLATVPKSAA